MLEDWLGAEMETNSSSLASHLLAWLEEWLEAQRLWLSLHPLHSRANANHLEQPLARRPARVRAPGSDADEAPIGREITRDYPRGGARLAERRRLSDAMAGALWWTCFGGRVTDGRAAWRRSLQV